MESENTECTTRGCPFLSDYHCEVCEAHYCFRCTRMKCKNHMKKGRFIDAPRFREQLERWEVAERKL